jgi:hypothetical protein
MVDRVKGEGPAPLTLTRLGLIYHHDDGIYSRKWPLPVYLFYLVCGLNDNGSCDIMGVYKGASILYFFGISIGITRRLIDIGKKINFYFLQNV